MNRLKLASAAVWPILLLCLVGCGMFGPGATTTPVATTPAATPAPTPTATPALTITPTPTVGPGDFPLRFHVDGNAFVDQFGQKTVFRGVNMFDITYALHPDGFPAQVAWSKHYFDVMASWGVKIVRVPIYPADVRADGWTSIFAALDTTVAWAGANKIYVIIDFHSAGWLPDGWFPPGDPYHQSDTTEQEFLDFWDQMSKHYAGNDTVAFYELFNEPAREGSLYFGSPADWQAWKALAERAIAAIRKNDSSKTVLVGGLQSAYNLSYVEAAPVADGNVGYVTHPYPTQTTPSWDVAFGNLSARHPVMATEFNYDCANYHNILVGGKPYNQAIIYYLEGRHISWLAFAFESAEDCPLLGGDGSPDYVPTPQGWYFRSWLLYESEGSPKPRPGDFNKISPSEGAGGVGSSPVLSWSYSPAAASFKYCVDATANNACDSSWTSAGTSTSVALSGLTAGTKYSWQVRATNADGVTYADGGEWGSFTAG